MTSASEPTILPADLYARIADAWSKNPELEGLLLEDFSGTVATRFGVILPKPATFVRTANGFSLLYDGKSFALTDPRHATNGELNDAELELVSGGGCPAPAPKFTAGLIDPQAFKNAWDIVI